MVENNEEVFDTFFQCLIWLILFFLVFSKWIVISSVGLGFALYLHNIVSNSALADEKNGGLKSRASADKRIKLEAKKKKLETSQSKKVISKVETNPKPCSKSDLPMSLATLCHQKFFLQANKPITKVIENKNIVDCFNRDNPCKIFMNLDYTHESVSESCQRLENNNNNLLYFDDSENVLQGHRRKVKNVFSKCDNTNFALADEITQVSKTFNNVKTCNLFTHNYTITHNIKPKNNNGCTTKTKSNYQKLFYKIGKSYQEEFNKISFFRQSLNDNFIFYKKFWNPDNISHENFINSRKLKQYVCKTLLRSTSTHVINYYNSNFCKHENFHDVSLSLDTLLFMDEKNRQSYKNIHPLNSTPKRLDINSLHNSILPFFDKKQPKYLETYGNNFFDYNSTFRNDLSISLDEIFYKPISTPEKPLTLYRSKSILLLMPSSAKKPLNTGNRFYPPSPIQQSPTEFEGKNKRKKNSNQNDKSISSNNKNHYFDDRKDIIHTQNNCLLNETLNGHSDDGLSNTPPSLDFCHDEEIVIRSCDVNPKNSYIQNAQNCLKPTCSTPPYKYYCNGIGSPKNGNVNDSGFEESIYVPQQHSASNGIEQSLNSELLTTNDKISRPQKSISPIPILTKYTEKPFNHAFDPSFEPIRTGKSTDISENCITTSSSDKTENSSLKDCLFELEIIEKSPVPSSLNSSPEPPFLLYTESESNFLNQPFKTSGIPIVSTEQEHKNFSCSNNIGHQFENEQDLVIPTTITKQTSLHIYADKAISNETFEQDDTRRVITDSQLSKPIPARIPSNIQDYQVEVLSEATCHLISPKQVKFQRIDTETLTPIEDHLVDVDDINNNTSTFPISNPVGDNNYCSQSNSPIFDQKGSSNPLHIKSTSFAKVIAIGQNPFLALARATAHATTISSAKATFETMKVLNSETKNNEVVCNQPNGSPTKKPPGTVITGRRLPIAAKKTIVKPLVKTSSSLNGNSTMTKSVKMTSPLKNGTCKETNDYNTIEKNKISATKNGHCVPKNEKNGAASKITTTKKMDFENAETKIPKSNQNGLKHKSTSSKILTNDNVFAELSIKVSASCKLRSSPHHTTSLKKTNNGNQNNSQPKQSDYQTNNIVKGVKNSQTILSHDSKNAQNEKINNTVIQSPSTGLDTMEAMNKKIVTENIIKSTASMPKIQGYAQAIKHALDLTTSSQEAQNNGETTIINDQTDLDNIERPSSRSVTLVFEDDFQENSTPTLNKDDDSIKIPKLYLINGSPLEKTIQGLKESDVNYSLHAQNVTNESLTSSVTNEANMVTSQLSDIIVVGNKSTTPFLKPILVNSGHNHSVNSQQSHVENHSLHSTTDDQAIQKAPTMVKPAKRITLSNDVIEHEIPYEDRAGSWLPGPPEYEDECSESPIPQSLKQAEGRLLGVRGKTYAPNKLLYEKKGLINTAPKLTKTQIILHDKGRDLDLNHENKAKTSLEIVKSSALTNNTNMIKETIINKTTAAVSESRDNTIVPKNVSTNNYCPTKETQKGGFTGKKCQNYVLNTNEKHNTTLNNESKPLSNSIVVSKPPLQKEMHPIAINTSNQTQPRILTSTINPYEAILKNSVKSNMSSTLSKVNSVSLTMAKLDPIDIDGIRNERKTVNQKYMDDTYSRCQTHSKGLNKKMNISNLNNSFDCGEMRQPSPSQTLIKRLKQKYIQHHNNNKIDNNGLSKNRSDTTKLLMNTTLPIIHDFSNHYETAKTEKLGHSLQSHPVIHNLMSRSLCDISKEVDPHGSINQDENFNSITARLKTQALLDTEFTDILKESFQKLRGQNNSKKLFANMTDHHFNVITVHAPNMTEKMDQCNNAFTSHYPLNTMKKRSMSLGNVIGLLSTGGTKTKDVKVIATNSSVITGSGRLDTNNRLLTSAVTLNDMEMGEGVDLPLNTLQKRAGKSINDRSSTTLLGTHRALTLQTNLDDILAQMSKDKTPVHFKSLGNLNDDQNASNSIDKKHKKDVKSSHSSHFANGFVNNGSTNIINESTKVNDMAQHILQATSNLNIPRWLSTLSLGPAKTKDDTYHFKSPFRRINERGYEPGDYKQQHRIDDSIDIESSLNTNSFDTASEFALSREHKLGHFERNQQGIRYTLPTHLSLPDRLRDYSKTAHDAINLPSDKTDTTTEKDIDINNFNIDTNDLVSSVDFSVDTNDSENMATGNSETRSNTNTSSYKTTESHVLCPTVYNKDLIEGSLNETTEGTNMDNIPGDSSQQSFISYDDSSHPSETNHYQNSSSDKNYKKIISSNGSTTHSIDSTNQGLDSKLFSLGKSKYKRMKNKSKQHNGSASFNLKTQTIVKLNSMERLNIPVLTDEDMRSNSHDGSHKGNVKNLRSLFEENNSDTNNSSNQKFSAYKAIWNRAKIISQHSFSKKAYEKSPNHPTNAKQNGNVNNLKVVNENLNLNGETGSTDDMLSHLKCPRELYICEEYIAKKNDSLNSRSYTNSDAQKSHNKSKEGIEQKNEPSNQYNNNNVSSLNTSGVTDLDYSSTHCLDTSFKMNGMVGNNESTHNSTETTHKNNHKINGIEAYDEKNDAPFINYENVNQYLALNTIHNIPKIEKNESTANINHHGISNDAFNNPKTKMDIETKPKIISKTVYLKNSKTLLGKPRFETAV